MDKLNSIYSMNRKMLFFIGLMFLCPITYARVICDTTCHK